MNTESLHSSRLFKACCLALIVTAMTFAIRAGILPQLGAEFGLTNTELGLIASMAFLGFPVATMLGGAVYNQVGAKKLLYVAFVCHVIGLVMTIFSGGFWSLLISTFFIGFANGAVEAGCNPLITELYPKDKTTMLNRFHVWFPGGILIGAIVSKLMTDAGLNWQWQIATMLVPTAIYAVMVVKEKFPELSEVAASTADNVKALLSPLFLFMMVCMTLTAVTELVTNQWVTAILGASGASPMLILALITGLMAVGRFFAGPIVHRLNPVGVLLASAVIATAGIYSMSIATGPYMYLAAVLFAIGVMYFWPTMLGFVAENTPETGALGISLVGGAGMFAVSMWTPVIGAWIDGAKAQAEASNLSAEQVELVAGQTVLTNLTLFPLALIVAFGALYFYMSSRNKQLKAATTSL